MRVIHFDGIPANASSQQPIQFIVQVHTLTHKTQYTYVKCGLPFNYQLNTPTHTPHTHTCTHIVRPLWSTRRCTSAPRQSDREMARSIESFSLHVSPAPRMNDCCSAQLAPVMRIEHKFCLLRHNRIMEICLVNLATIFGCCLCLQSTVVTKIILTVNFVKHSMQLCSSLLKMVTTSHFSNTGKESSSGFKRDFWALKHNNDVCPNST